jgi:WD40 repeat protein
MGRQQGGGRSVFEETQDSAHSSSPPLAPSPPLPSFFSPRSSPRRSTLSHQSPETNNTATAIAPTGFSPFSRRSSYSIMTSPSVVKELSAHKQEVCGLKWSFDEKQLASGGNDNKLFVWNMAGTGERGAAAGGGAGEVEPEHKFVDHTAAVKAIAWSPHQVTHTHRHTQTPASTSPPPPPHGALSLNGSQKSPNSFSLGWVTCQWGWHS